jgi:hypothetical protein
MKSVKLERECKPDYFIQKKPLMSFKGFFDIQHSF